MQTFVPKISRENLQKYVDEGLSRAEIARQTGISTGTIFDYLNRYQLQTNSQKEWRLKKGRRHLVNESFFEKFTLKSCYWAGFIAADGYIGYKKSPEVVKINLKPFDLNHLKKFKKDIEFEGDVSIYKYFYKGKDSSRAKIAICSKQICLDLEKNFNIKNAKSFNLKFPTLFPTNEHRLAFIIGAIDGDGCMILRDKNNGLFSFNYVGGARDFVLGVKRGIESLDPTHSKRKLQKIEKSKSILYRFELAGYQALSLMYNLYKVDCPKLERKWDIISKALQLEKYRQIKEGVK